jgi:hypothetical protein
MQSYSYLNASIGLSLAALYAGKIPNINPIAVAHPKARRIDENVMIHATIFLIAKIIT